MAWGTKALGLIGALGVAVITAVGVVAGGSWFLGKKVAESTPEDRQKFGETVGRGAYGAAAGTVDVLKGAANGALQEGKERNPELARQAEEAAKRARDAVTTFEFPLIKQDSAPFVTPPASGTGSAEQQANKKFIKNYVCSTFKSKQTQSEGFRSLGLSPDEKCEEPSGP